LAQGQRVPDKGGQGPLWGGRAVPAEERHPKLAPTPGGGRRREAGEYPPLPVRAAFRVIRADARQLAKWGAFEPLAFALGHKLNVRMSLQADGLKTSVLRTGQLPTGRKRVLLSFA
jgi:hypothetical protein